MTHTPGTPPWWDARYAAKESMWGLGPNRFVQEAFADAAPHGSRRALDLACGEGRNALWLAERGWTSTGVDFSPVAIERANSLGEARGLEVEWIVADVTTWTPSDPYALIVVAYLHLDRESLRAVWRQAAHALEPGGELFLIGHARRNLSEGVGGPQNADLLWDPDELAEDVRAAGLEPTTAEHVLRPVEGKGEAIDARLRAKRP